MEYSLHLLGIPEAYVAGELIDLALDKPASLLYYLARRFDWVSRSELAFLYRPDAPEKVALSNVRTYIHRGKERLWAASLEVGKFRVRFPVETDVRAFEKALEQQDWADALSLYRGPFLEGIVLHDVPGYETWLELERQDLSQKWRTAALSCAYALEEQRDFAGAEGWLEQVLKADPLDEDCLQALLRILFATGKRSQALETYKNFCHELRRELDVEPLEATRALLESLNQSEPEALSLQSPKPKLKHNLPAQTTRFVGRRRELERLSEILTKPECRLLTVVGLGGVGKTRLALELAAGQLEVFVDGVWFVPLAGVSSPDLLVWSIASATEFNFSGPGDPQEQLINFLRDKELLLLLDNFEHLVEGAVLLEELFEAAPKLNIIATSRVALELSGEWLFDLRGLSYPPVDTEEPLESFDAVKLFNIRAERLSATFVPEGETLSAVAELTRRVEGMPLALELAATWTRSLSMPQLLAELSKGIDVLSSQLRDLPERHRSLQNVFDYSWQHLSVREQEALANLSIFQGGFTLEAAEKVAEVHLALLLSLINHSLVRRSQEGRYQLHELVRQFIKERFNGQTNAELEADLSRYYLERLAQSEPELRGENPRQVFDLLLVDLDNLRLACSVVIQNADWSLLTTSLDGLHTFYHYAVLLEEGKRLFTQITTELYASISLETKPTYVKALLNLGSFERVVGSLSEAEAIFQRATELARALDLKLELGLGLHHLGWIKHRLGDLDTAETMLQKSMSLSKMLNQQSLYASSLQSWADIKRARGQYDEVILSLQQCLSVRENLRDSHGIANAILNLTAMLREAKGAKPEHIPLLNRALALARRIGDRQTEAVINNLQGMYALELGKYRESERLFKDSLQAVKQFGNKQEQVHLLFNLGFLFQIEQRYNDARPYFQQALEISEAIDSFGLQVLVIDSLAENAWKQNDLSTAAVLLQTSLRLITERDIPRGLILRTLRYLGQFQAHKGEFEAAFLLAAFAIEQEGMLSLDRKRLKMFYQEISSKLLPKAKERLEQEAASLNLEAMLARQLALLEDEPPLSS